VVASLFAAPERSQGTVVHEAMSALIPPDPATGVVSMENTFRWVAACR
jgi:hypothetical protein